VRVEVSGDGRVRRVELSDDVLRTGTREELQDMLKAALDSGIEQAARLRDERMAQVTGGLQLPGLM
jgi:DNA-binding protein YbaB